MMAVQQLEALAVVSCDCCGTPVPYVASAPAPRGGAARPRWASCSTCGFKYRLVVSAQPGGELAVRPRPC